MTDTPVRPPPSSAPADFDAAMTERWDAWVVKGRLEGARARRQLGVAVTVAGAVAIAALVFANLIRP